MGTEGVLCGSSLTKWYCSISRAYALHNHATPNGPWSASASIASITEFVSGIAGSFDQNSERFHHFACCHGVVFKTAHPSHAEEYVQGGIQLAGERLRTGGLKEDAPKRQIPYGRGGMRAVAAAWLHVSGRRLGSPVSHAATEQPPRKAAATLARPIPSPFSEVFFGRGFVQDSYQSFPGLGFWLCAYLSLMAS